MFDDPDDLRDELATVAMTLTTKDPVINNHAKVDSSIEPDSSTEADSSELLLSPSIMIVITFGFESL